MEFSLPQYTPPDFAEGKFVNAPAAQTAPCPKDGVAPENYHGTSIFPEYFKVGGQWKLAADSRMDSVVVLRQDGGLEVVEPRRLQKGDRVFTGRSENCEEGIFLHTDGFHAAQPGADEEKFAFRGGRSRETAFSIDYDKLYALLHHEREHGNVLWVMGPVVSFDSDTRKAMQSLVEGGFVHGMLAGNALATHDLEAELLGTALGQDVYTQQRKPLGHYNHLDTINKVRQCGSIESFLDQYGIRDGIMASLVNKRVPFVLAGSIRDDGPLPEVIGNVYEAQSAMRDLVRKATTIICVATQLHTIATGNLAPCFRVADGQIRPLYIYCVDASEFVINKLADRGSLSAVGIVTNAQDFIVNVARGVKGADRNA